ncbi:hypothetical protein BX600DRAFT_308719 [Xylariales sp. PMI_506]|nr:hypothetical protein BX600DRAFT_308719 [Xylariales sp. PMI_506]
MPCPLARPVACTLGAGPNHSESRPRGRVLTYVTLEQHASSEAGLRKRTTLCAASSSCLWLLLGDLRLLADSFLFWGSNESWRTRRTSHKICGLFPRTSGRMHTYEVHTKCESIRTAGDRVQDITSESLKMDHDISANSFCLVYTDGRVVQPQLVQKSAEHMPCIDLGRSGAYI